MLVLTRKAGEELLIGEEVVLTVLDVRGDGVKIGIEAPRHVEVKRREIIKEVAETNQKAALASREAAEALKALLAAAQKSASHAEDGGTRS